MIYTLPSGLKVELFFKHYNPASSKCCNLVGTRCKAPCESPCESPCDMPCVKDNEKTLSQLLIEDSIKYLEKKGYFVLSKEDLEDTPQALEPHLDPTLAHTEVHLVFKNKMKKTSHVAVATCAHGDVFRKQTGRKIALRRLLDELPFTLDYDDRKALWAIALPKKVK